MHTLFERFLVVGVLLATGCVGVAPATSVIKLNTPPRALHERDAEAVPVFTSGAPTRPFVEVALIQSRREWGTTQSAEEIFHHLRAAGAKAGCDGLILLGEANIVSGSIYSTIGVAGPETWGEIETSEGFRATCIAWRDEAAPVTPPAVAPEP